MIAYEKEICTYALVSQSKRKAESPVMNNGGGTRCEIAIQLFVCELLTHFLDLLHLSALCPASKIMFTMKSHKTSKVAKKETNK